MKYKYSELPTELQEYFYQEDLENSLVSFANYPRDVAVEYIKKKLNENYVFMQQGNTIKMFLEVDEFESPNDKPVA